MAAGDVTVFNTAKEWLMDGTFDLDGDTFKLAICDNTATPTAAFATPALGDFTQVGTAGTYLAGGEALTATWVESTGTVTLDFTNNPSWAQHASNDVDAYWGIIYADNVTVPFADCAIAFVDLGGPVDMSAGSLTVTFAGTGLFTLA